MGASAALPESLAVRAAVRGSLAGFAAGDLVLVACSGGPDSLALAAGAAWACGRAGIRCGVVVVDHGLQEGSAGVAAGAARACGSLGLDPVLVVAAEVPRGPGGPEDRARRARRTAIAEAAGRAGAVAVLLGHTRDDQAETVLLRLARGSGARSLAAMSPRATAPGPDGRPVAWLRPLLDLPRSVVRAAAEQAGLDAWEDPHNADPAYARSRVRTDALPALVAALGDGVVDGLARTARLARDDADALDAWAERARAEAMAAGAGPAGIELDVDVLAPLPRAIRTRVIRESLLSVGAPAGSLTAAHVLAVDALVCDWHGQGRADLPGASAQRRHGTLILTPSGTPEAAPDDTAGGSRAGG